MTVSSQTSAATFVGNGAATAFPLPFRFFNNSDIRAYFIDSTTGAATAMAIGVDYTLIGAGEPEVDGSSLSLLTTTVPLASMRGLYVERVMPQVQETDIVNQGEFFASTHEDVFDRLTMLIQQSIGERNGAIRVAIGDPEPARLSPAAQRANLLLGFDSFGNPIAVSPVSGSASDLALLLAGSTGSEHIGRGAGTVETALDALEADVVALEAADVSLGARIDNLPPVNRAQPLMSRANKVLGLGQGVVILGDSISAGAYFGNAHTNGWPNLLSKAINHQFGARNLGAMPMDSLYNVVAAYNTDQLHAVTWVGDWGSRIASPAPYDFPVGNVGAAAGDAVNGKTVSSTSSGAYVEFVIPSFNSIAIIYYVGRIGGGTFNVTVNGVAAPALNTSNATLLYNKTHAINLPDNGDGEVTVRLTKADSGVTELQSVIQYRKGDGGPFEHFPLMNVCNHSVVGRQLKEMTEQGIINATNCACLIMALGYNDRFAETDDTYYANYLQRVEWVIEYANINQCLVVVPDFCWYWPKSSRVRTQLRRIAEETSGIYIPFPDKFFPDGRIAPDITPSQTLLVSDLQLFADNAHPNYKGSELIFNQIAEALGLGITSRRMALLNDLPYPVKLQGTLKNKAGAVSTVSRLQHGVLYNLGVTETGGGTIAPSTVAVAAVPAKFGAVELRASTDVNAFVAGAVGSHLNTAENGTVTAVVTTAAEISSSFVVSTK